MGGGIGCECTHKFLECDLHQIFDAFIWVLLCGRLLMKNIHQYIALYFWAYNIYYMQYFAEIGFFNQLGSIDLI